MSVDVTLPVRCKKCGKTYQCTPATDYYNATNNADGVCWSCLLNQNGLKATIEPVQEGVLVPTSPLDSSDLVYIDLDNFDDGDKEMR